MRDHVSERRDGLNDTSGGSSETDAREFTISPAGSPPGAAVTNATPVAKRPSASRNSRASGGVAAWAVEAARTMSVERRLLAERDAREVVVRPVRAERVHERAGLDVAVCTRERAPVHVAGPARQGQRAVDDLRRGLADEGLRGLCLRDEGPQLGRRAVQAGGGRGARSASGWPSEPGWAARWSSIRAAARDKAERAVVRSTTLSAS